MRFNAVVSEYRGWSVAWAWWLDVFQIARLEHQVFLEPLSWPQVAAKILHRRTRYLVVRDHAAIVAYFGFEVWGSYAHVIANVTDPRYRHQGLATFLLTAAEPAAQALGARLFLGEVRRSNQPQLGVLEKIGWEVMATLPGFFQNGEDAYLVVKVLSRPGRER